MWVFPLSGQLLSGILSRSYMETGEISLRRHHFRKFVTTSDLSWLCRFSYREMSSPVRLYKLGKWKGFSRTEHIPAPVVPTKLPVSQCSYHATYADSCVRSMEITAILVLPKWHCLMCLGVSLPNLPIRHLSRPTLVANWQSDSLFWDHILILKLSLLYMSVCLLLVTSQQTIWPHILTSEVK